MQNKKDLTRKQVTNLLRDHDISLRALSISTGRAPSTLANALDRPFKEGELIIAQVLNLEVEQIWPERWEKRRKKEENKQRINEFVKNINEYAAGI